MHITGIICEYNPFHNGHKKQLDAVRTAYPEGGIVCLMSGYYVQRGAPAILDPALRAEAAVQCGADLVLEMPVTGSLSSAEGFAQTGVEILGGFCNRLCFGTESGTAQSLMETAEKLLSPEFPELLRAALDTGVSFPRARQIALENMHADAALLERPNDILAVEYCKAILAQNSPMGIFPIRRAGDYHNLSPERENPSASAVRKLLLEGGDWAPCVPAAELLQNAPLHSLENGEKAILYRLRTMTDGDFEALPYGSEGLWRRLMHAARREDTREDILTAVKSKRYTRTRLDRMLLCAVLGVTREILETPAPYTRVLAMNGTGRKLLKTARETGMFLNCGETAPLGVYRELEQRCTDLYGLFADPPRPPIKKRISIVK